MKRRFLFILAGVLLLGVFLGACSGDNKSIPDGLFVAERSNMPNLSYEFKDGEVTSTHYNSLLGENVSVTYTYTYKDKTLTFGEISMPLEVVDNDTLLIHGNLKYKRQ